MSVCKIKFKSDKKKSMTVKLNTLEDVKNLYTLCNTEIYRNSYLADIDYEDKSGLSFKLDGEKISAVKLRESLKATIAKYENGDSNLEETYSVKKKKKKKDKKKKHDKDKKKDKKKKHKKKNKKPEVSPDGYVTIHRA